MSREPRLLTITAKLRGGIDPKGVQPDRRQVHLQRQVLHPGHHLLRCRRLLQGGPGGYAPSSLSPSSKHMAVPLTLTSTIHSDDQVRKSDLRQRRCDRLAAVRGLRLRLCHRHC